MLNQRSMESKTSITQQTLREEELRQNILLIDDSQNDARDHIVHALESRKDCILFGDSSTSLRHIPDGVVQSVITSPPYWSLRDY